MKKDNVTFEEILEKLDAAVRRLESGELPLSEALTAYEEAVRLVRLGTETLEEAEQRVRILTEHADGSVTEAPFAVSDET